MESVGSHLSTFGLDDVEVAKHALTELFGFQRDPVIKDVKRKTQKFGKIVQVDEDYRRSIVVRLTEEFGIYSLGRYATWRPLLLDDVVKDIEVIERLMGSKYSRGLY